MTMNASSHSQPDPDTVPAMAPDKEARTWAMIAHLAALTAYLGNGFGIIVGPLIVWLIKRDSMPLVNDQGRESLNFNIPILIYLVCCVPLILLAGPGLLLMAVIGIFHLVFTIVAAVKAYDGEAYRYPLTLRLIK